VCAGYDHDLDVAEPLPSVATDGSVEAQTALRLANKIAQRRGACALRCDASAAREHAGTVTLDGSADGADAIAAAAAQRDATLVLVDVARVQPTRRPARSTRSAMSNRSLAGSRRPGRLSPDAIAARSRVSRVRA
jgi:hypothetical protein